MLEANGSQGITGGQALEIELDPTTLQAKQLQKINLWKTAALIRTAIKLGGIIANVPDQQLAVLDEYGKHLGLAFQAQDDLHDNDRTIALNNKSKQNALRLLQQLPVNHSLLTELTQHILS